MNIPDARLSFLILSAEFAWGIRGHAHARLSPRRPFASIHEHEQGVRVGVDRCVRRWLRAALAAVVLACGPAFAADPDLAPFSELQTLGLGFKELGGHLPPPGAFGGQNEATITQDGSSNRAHAVQYGGGNQLTATQTGYGNVAALLQAGLQNTISLSQAGDANQALIAQLGAFNNAAVVQNGVNNVVQILQVGNGLNVSVTQNGNNMTARVVQRN